MIIFYLRLVVLPNGSSNLHQGFHRNRTGGAAQVMEDGGGGKFGNARKILSVQIVHGVQAAAGEKGVLDACGHKAAEAHLQIQIVQFFQKAVPGVIGKVAQTVTIDLIHGVDGHIHKLVANVSARIGTIPLSQGSEDGRVVFLPHLPQVRLPRPAHRTGVRIVIDILQTGLAPLVFSDDRDALGTGLDPAAHSAIP